MFRAASLALVLSFVVGCARAETAADRHAAQSGEVLDRLARDQDHGGKLGSPAVTAEDGAVAAPSRDTRGARPAASGGPSGTVIIDGERSPEGGDDPDDPATRPQVRVVGSGGAPRSARQESRGARGAIEIREVPAEAAEPGEPARSPDGRYRASVLDPDARAAYDAAIELVNQKDYPRALEALNGFLVRWPDHPYAENAMYWRGEVFFAQGRFPESAAQFEAVLSRFGAGRKAADALLKLGMCHERMGAPARAKQSWSRLEREFPRSEAARKIPKETR